MRKTEILSVFKQMFTFLLKILPELLLFCSTALEKYNLLTSRDCEKLSSSERKQLKVYT